MNENYFNIRSNNILKEYHILRAEYINDENKKRIDSFQMSFGLRYHLEPSDFTYVDAFSDLGHRYRPEKSYFREEYERFITLFSDIPKYDDLSCVDLLLFFKTFQCHSMAVNHYIFSNNWFLISKIKELLMFYYSLNEDEDMPLIYSKSYQNIYDSYDVVISYSDPPLGSTLKVEILRILKSIKNSNLKYPCYFRGSSKEQIIDNVFANEEFEILDWFNKNITF